MMKLQRCVTFVISADFAGTPKIGYCVSFVVPLVGYSSFIMTNLAIGIRSAVGFDVEIGHRFAFITIFTINYGIVFV